MKNVVVFFAVLCASFAAFAGEDDMPFVCTSGWLEKGPGQAITVIRISGITDASGGHRDVKVEISGRPSFVYPGAEVQSEYWKGGFWVEGTDSEALQIVWVGNASSTNELHILNPETKKPMTFKAVGCEFPETTN